MNSPLYSPHWYRVAELKPTLRPHTQIHRHLYRGQPWYILQDHITGRIHRFSPAAYQLIGLMNGQRSMQEIWDSVDELLDESAPTQQEAIDLLAQLHGADALQTDILPDTQELFRRSQKRRQQNRKKTWWNPLAIRLPLVDPNEFLSRTQQWVKPLFSWTGFVLWLAVVLIALLLAGMHWSELSENTATQILSFDNLYLLWFCYPLIKALHELGHGYATKRYGGEVHEMGIMLLALIPAPYVNATAASAFPKPRHRIIVSTIGIMVEAFIAACALFIWLAVEPGTIRSIAYNIMLIAGFSTLFINGNPLLRFDGYYAFVDAIGIPSLATRSNKYLGYLIQRYLFGLTSARSPVTHSSEKPWLAGYSIAAYIYRMVILAAIALFVADEYATLGMLIVAWAFITLILTPCARLIGFLFDNPGLNQKRIRAVTISLLLTGSLLATLLWLPFPYSTQTMGVVWIPEQAAVRAGVDATVHTLLAKPNSLVKTGTPLFATDDPFLQMRINHLEAKHRELQARYSGLINQKPVQAQIVNDEILALDENLDQAREELSKLTIVSPMDGEFLVEWPDDMTGKFLHKGDLVAYIADPQKTVVQTMITQDDISLIRQNTQAIEARLANAPRSSLSASLHRITPAASNQLPSPALGNLGGGPFAVDPSDENGTRTLEKLFQLELILPIQTHTLGGRVNIRFEHEKQPLVQQWYRQLSQLFLKRLDV